MARRNQALSNQALSELAAATAAIGADEDLIQGAGGNTSLKIAGTLWVKASGAWMRDALVSDMFVPTPLAQMREAALYGDQSELDRLARSCVSPNGARPSIEACLHAIMPHPVVVHAHAVNATVCAVLSDGRARFEQAMDEAGIAGQFASYVKPGVALAGEVVRLMSEHGRADAILLQNHGIVIGAASAAAAVELLMRVEAALGFAARPTSANEDRPTGTHESEAYEAAPEHGFAACDAFLHAALTRAPLTPDQVVFLGGAPGSIMPGERCDEAAARARDLTGLTPVLLYSRQHGAFRRRQLTPGEAAMSRALAAIARRIPEGAPVVGLSQAAAHELANWDAEKYRRDLDGVRA
ncbi:MAG: class II aldolase/adducin family protein [Hyphomonadaceae bacterium]